MSVIVVLIGVLSWIIYDYDKTEKTVGSRLALWAMVFVWLLVISILCESKEAAILFLIIALALSGASLFFGFAIERN